MKSSTQLFFDYSSNAKIRIKKQNCYVSPDFPAVFRILTQKLDFLVPKAAVLFAKEHVYIPNDIYKQALIRYYKNLKINI